MDSFKPVNDLEKLFAEAASDAAARPAFYRALPDAQLFIIPEGPPPERDGEFVSDGSTQFRMRTVDLQGRPHLPVFTSAERIAAVVEGEVGFVSMNGRTLLTALRGQDLVLNPGATVAKLLSAAEVASILDGSLFAPQAHGEVAAGTKMLLGQPAEYPRHITDPLAALFKRLRHVQSAYLAHASIGGAPPHTLIGIATTGEWDRVVEEAGLVVREVAKDGEVVDFTRLNDDPSGPVASYMRQQTKPFYRRRSFLGIF